MSELSVGRTAIAAVRSTLPFDESEKGRARLTAVLCFSKRPMRLRDERASAHHPDRSLCRACDRVDLRQ